MTTIPSRDEFTTFTQRLPASQREARPESINTTSHPILETQTKFRADPPNLWCSVPIGLCLYIMCLFLSFFKCSFWRTSSYSFATKYCCLLDDFCSRGTVVWWISLAKLTAGVVVTTILGSWQHILERIAIDSPFSYHTG